VAQIPSAFSKQVWSPAGLRIWATSVNHSTFRRRTAYTPAENGLASGSA